jgi:hypothetical protein
MGTSEWVDTFPLMVLRKPVAGWTAWWFACVSLSELRIAGMNPNQVVLNDVLELFRAASPVEADFLRAMLPKKQ